MKLLVLLSLLALSGLNLAAEIAVGPNPVADPFTTSSKIELPPLPPIKASGLELPVAPFPSNPQTFPQNLRVILIRDKGQGLLGSTEAGALSIAVADGKSVRIAGQNYYAEVRKTEIKLYSAKKGMLVWEGSLAGVAPVSVQSDTSQAKYIPPLSAGVSPGLKSTDRPGGSASQPIIKAPGSP